MAGGHPGPFRTAPSGIQCRPLWVVFAGFREFWEPRRRSGGEDV
jgi:hypothetical protein